jgi:hypothetical protein
MRAPQESRAVRFAMGEGPTVLAMSIADLKVTYRPRKALGAGRVRAAGGRHG